MPQKHALKVTSAVHIASEVGSKIAELIVVDDEGSIVQPMTIENMRSLAALLQREAARLEKGLPHTHKHSAIRLF